MHTRDTAPDGLRALGVLVLGCLALLACNGTTGPGGLRIEVQGRLERGLTVQLTVIDDGTTISPERVRWSAEPGDAVEFPAGDEAVLLQAGEVILEATVQERSGERRIEVSVPPAVFFDMVRDGNRDIYRAALDGKDLVRLTSDPSVDVDPDVASGTLVFASLRDGNRELYSMPADGGTPDRLTQNGVTDKDPALSPDGQRLAFVRNATGVFRLWTASSDGSGAQAATGDFGGSGAIERSPSWAPIGHLLVFMSTAAGTAGLYRWDSNDISPVVDSDGVEVEPAWSPGGGRVVFAADRDGETAAADLLVVDLDTGSEMRLTDRTGNEGQPAWLPDGRVVYTVFAGNTTELRWLEPDAAGSSVVIPLVGEAPENPAAERSP